jgi:hypothetical protein
VCVGKSAELQTPGAGVNVAVGAGVGVLVGVAVGVAVATAATDVEPTPQAMMAKTTIPRAPSLMKRGEGVGIALAPLCRGHHSAQVAVGGAPHP